MTLLPALSKTTLLINSSACTAAEATCPSPTPTLWTQSGADLVSNDQLTIGNQQPPSSWDSDYASVLRMQGSGNYFSQRITYEDSLFTGGGIGISSSYATTYPGGAAYTLDTGFYSLYGAEETLSWSSLNGTTFTTNRTLPDVYTNGFIPSISYGLHVGSVNANVSGSLVLGGYDSARCLDAPVTSESEAFSLTSITLNVSSGSNVYFNATSMPISNLLRANGSAVTSLPINPDPGLPYLYLPRDTCDSIAAHLPVSYNTNYNLYFWNTTAPTYQPIISSPHFLAFSFSGSDSSSTTINIPFALMSLNLTWPLVPQGTEQPYFPCSPWEPGNTAGYYLGRAFLQGAFLAQNWNSSTMWMAQAPGPGGISVQSPKTIGIDATSIVPAVQPPTWDSTWSILTPLSSNASLGSGDTNPASSATSTPTNQHSTSISGGAIAGIVIGVLVVIGLVAGLGFWCMRKRRVETRPGRELGHELQPQEDVRPYYGNPLASPQEKAHHATEQTGMLAEAPSPDYRPPVELAGREMQELDGTERYAHK